MSIISLILIIAILGFVCWLVPMPAPFPRIIVGLICLLVVIWLLQQFGLLHGDLRLR